MRVNEQMNDSMKQFAAQEVSRKRKREKVKLQERDWQPPVFIAVRYWESLSSVGSGGYTMMIYRELRWL